MDEDSPETVEATALAPKKETESGNLNSTDSSLSLSITPPILDDDGTENKVNSDSISEHISTESNSIENDRSFQEIEIDNQPFLNLLSNDGVHLSQETNPFSLNDSEHSLNLKNSSGTERVQSILDEILNNSQFNDSSSVTNSKEESLNIFANLDLDDKSLTLGYKPTNETSLNERNLYLPLKSETDTYGDVFKKIKDLEEIVDIKDTTIAALTSELDSYREMSNPNTMSMVSTTEYKQLQEECHNKLLEYSNAIIVKNDLIQQLTESLDQSVVERKLLLSQIENFKDEIAQLQIQLQETTEMVKNHSCDIKTESKESSPKLAQELVTSVLPVDIDYLNIESKLNVEQLELFNVIKNKVDQYVIEKVTEKKKVYEQEIQELKGKMSSEKEEYDQEIKRLRDLLANIKCGSTEIMELKNELEAKYSKEVEELRTYFEKKCSDLEKNYSEEIFSQHSRKMSGSSISENELNSDVFFTPAPGPGGDVPNPFLTKKDILKLKSELENMLDTISNCDLETLNDDDLKRLREDFKKCPINNVIRYDLTNIRLDLQNKYHAELEIMNEQHENTIDMMNVEFEKKLKETEEELMKVKSQVQVYNVSSSVQEVASSGEFEINEVVESYERRLQEQVTLAKIDIISALENQIQRLVANEAEDEAWPSELLQLRDRFTDKYERQISQLRDEHESEVAKLKEEHLKQLNSALERARRRSLRDSDNLNKGELELLKERDVLKNQTVSLRHLLGELLKYFTECEDELNNTLVDELLKQGFERNLTQLEEELLNDSSNSSRTDSSYVRRVHITPNFGDILNLIENKAGQYESVDVISLDLRNELGQCLEKLKQDANAILALTSIPRDEKIDNSPRKTLEEKVTSLTRQLISETQAKDKLKDELEEMTSVLQSIEKEKDNLEAQLEQIVLKDNVLEEELVKARDKIAELIENGHKEIVSVGYGDCGQQGIGDTMQTLLDLQDKARNVLSNSRTSADPLLLGLIEDLCQICERIKEESKREKLDLLQQVNVGSSNKFSSGKIDAADKKYRQTRQFLDEQANEREIERDEAQKRIELLQEQLKERDRDRTTCERITTEVEQLEAQIQELTRAQAEETRRAKEAESERDEAVDKIKVLREIIRELELQVENYQTERVNHLADIDKLKCIVGDQNQSIDDLKHLESLVGFSDIQQLKRHLDDVDAELERLRLSAELAGGEGAQKQIKKQLHELEVTLDTKTRGLEGLYCSNNSFSSPSEDISARDVVRPRTPNGMVMDDCEVPLQQLARLKEKLVRHSRAEDAAVKKIHDLEMQLFNVRAELEEAQGERDILKQQVQEHLVLISDLQIRLDEQRLRAEHNEKQVNTSLEVKIYDLQTEITNLHEIIQKKEKNINQLNMNLEETKRHLKKQEKELMDNKEDEIITSMQREIERLRQENNQMKKKMNNDAQILPNLVENIISDKNTDIEKLQDKLEDTQRKLQEYTSLSLDLKELQTLSHLKNSGNSLTEVLTLIDLSEPEQMRACQSREDTTPMRYNRTKNETVFLSAEPEISCIEKVGPPNVNFSAQGLRPNSTELYKSLEKRVHFEDDSIKRLNIEIEALKNELEIKDGVIKDCEDKIQILVDLENKIEMLQTALDTTEKALKGAQESFEREQKEILDREQNIRVELAEKKLHLSEKEKQISLLEKDSERKDQMLLNLTREKNDLEKAMAELKNENFKNVDKVINEKNEEIYKLQQEVEQSSNSELITNLQCEIDNLVKKLSDSQKDTTILQDRLKYLEEQLKESSETNAKLEKELRNNIAKVEEYKSECESKSKKLERNKQLIKDLEDRIKDQDTMVKNLRQQNQLHADQILDKNCEIEILNEDIKRFQMDYDEIKRMAVSTEAQDLRKTLGEKELIVNNLMKKIEELNQEVTHLQDLVNNKEKIISKITEDHRIVNTNLLTIQKKLKQPGGIMDLRQRLREEHKQKTELLQEIHTLKAQLMTSEITRKNNVMVNSVDDLTSQVKKELDFAAEIDTNILTAVSDQSLNSISESHDIETYKQNLQRLKIKNNELKQAKDSLMATIQELEVKCDQLNAEKLTAESKLEQYYHNLRQVQFEDAKLLEQLRIRLDAAMDNEEKFGKIIEEEKQIRLGLEAELDNLRLKQTNSKTESTEYKNLPNFEDRLKEELKREREKSDKLKQNIRQSEKLRKELDNNFNYATQMLELEQGRIKVLEEKNKTYLESVTVLKNELRREKMLMSEKVWQLEELKKTISELQRERENLIQEKNNLVLESAHNSKLITDQVPEVVMNKIKEINCQLENNRTLVDMINTLRIEKNQLEVELAEIKSKNPNATENLNLQTKCELMFAKVLRLMSYRKALLWQKRYLMDIVKNHETICRVELFASLRSGRNTHRNRKFKAVVDVVIVILRMKFLVRRWNSGVRAGGKINGRMAEQVHVQAVFQVGQPVSSQRFANNTAFRLDEEAAGSVRVESPVSIPWSGRTPPQKDKRVKIGNNLLDFNDFTPLRAPQLLAQFTERIDTIQETLGVALNSNTD
ncbi:centromere-associated protein E-like isoform X3 [Aethina tumida]|uniref:centromere-associated protein E-like isoform X3 n=1 Tax=Aethina tumida TaxID=116153 RepID=UPI0021490895|nr:centromere-associated protein E-like isoform X3 [Aethina tumida]